MAAPEIAIAAMIFEALKESDPTALVMGPPEEYGVGDRTLIDGNFDLLEVARGLVGAGPQESASVEITSEMLEAGSRVLYASGIVEGAMEADEYTLAEIYEAMFRLRPLTLTAGT